MGLVEVVLEPEPSLVCPAVIERVESVTASTPVSGTVVLASSVVVIPLGPAFSDVDPGRSTSDSPINETWES